MIESLKEHQQGLLYFLAAVGGVKIMRIFYDIVASCLKYLLLPSRNLKAMYGDGWAVITGASDGLGKQYAMQLAQQGFNVVLIARNREKLEAVAQIIRNRFSVEVQIVVFDFSTLCSLGSIRILESKLNEIIGPISILVNNVGQM